MKKKKQNNSLRGDTIVEAVIAIAIYSIVAVLALASMNSGLKSAQKNLESTMSRAAVDSQVDAIRYVYDGYIKSKESGGADAKYFQNLWKKIKDNFLVEVGGSNAALEEVIMDPDEVGSCADLIGRDAKRKGEPTKSRIFALNPRAFASIERLGTKSASELNGLDFVGYPSKDTLLNYVTISNLPTITTANIEAAPLYPRIIYNTNPSNADNIAEVSNILIGSNKNNKDNAQPARDAIKSEGVWMDLIHEDGKNAYDIYVRTCWNAAGEKAPTTYTTVVRLYKVDD